MFLDNLRIYLFTTLVVFYWNGWSQEASSLLNEDVIREQLMVIDSLLSDDKDEEAKSILDKVSIHIANSNKRDLLIQYHQFSGDYYLHVGKYAEAIDAYEPLRSLSNKDLSEASTLRLARGINDLGIAYFKVGDFMEAKNSHRESIVLYNLYNDMEGLGFNYNNLGLIFKELKEIDSAAYFLNKSMDAAYAAEDTVGIGFTHLNLGLLYTDNKELVKGLDHFHRSLDVFEKIGMMNMVNGVRRRLGAYYMKIQDFESSKPLLLAVLNYYEETDSRNQLGSTHNKVAELYFKLGQYDSTIYHITKALAILKTSKYTKGLGAAYYLRGKYHATNNNDEQAMSDFKTSLSYTSGKWKGDAMSTWLAAANIHLKNKNPEEAIANVEKAQKEVEGSPSQGNLLASYKVLSSAHKILGNTSQALEYLELFNKEKEEALGEEKRWEISRIEYRAHLEREKVSQEAEQMRKDQAYTEAMRRQRWNTYAAIATAVLLSIVAVSVFRSYRIKQLANRQLEQKNTTLQVLRQREKRLSMEAIDSKGRELATMAMSTHEKNSLLRELEQKVSFLENRMEEDLRPSLKEMRKTISESYSLDKSWDSFLHRFEDVHPHFFDKLKVENPNLTINDLKLSAYIKIGMNNKEIAKVSHLTLGSVKSSINRLKKKLRMTADDNVRDFMLKYA